MKRIRKYLDIRYAKHKDDWDTVVVIDGNGDVGVGKSNLALHILDYWMTKLYGKCEEQHIKQIGLTPSMYLSSLATSNVMDMCIYDEAGDLTSRRAMSHFNVKLMLAYKVIRADRIFTILVIDDIFDLDPYFRKKRVKALFSVERRGYVSVWLKNRLRAMLSFNQGLEIKNRHLVPPSFRDRFPKYEGVLKRGYDEVKRKKTSEARKQIMEFEDDSKIQNMSEKIKIKVMKKEIEKLEKELGEMSNDD